MNQDFQEPQNVPDNNISGIFWFNHKRSGRGTNPLLFSKQDEQQTGRAANRWTSLPDPFPLMAMMLGQFGLGPLRGPLLTAAFRQIHGIRLSIRESRPFQKMRRW